MRAFFGVASVVSVSLVVAAGCASDGGDSSGSTACAESLQSIEGCDQGRECNYDIAEGYCAAGNTAATLAMSDCFQLSGSCHTPADPGIDDVRTCFEDAIETHGTATSESVRAAADDLCDPLDYEPLMIEVFAVMAGEDIAEGMADCVEAAADCANVTACLNEHLGVPMPASCL